MIKEDTIREECSKCGAVRVVREQTYQCDTCWVDVERYPLLVECYHKHRPGVETHHFCSWHCLLSFLMEIDIDGFIQISVLEFGEDRPGMTVEDFRNEVRREW